MDDIVPGLLQQIQDYFEKLCVADPQLIDLTEQIKKGTDYETVSAYAIRLGELQSQAYLEYLGEDVLPDGKMYYNIADRILGPTLEADFEQIAEMTVLVQKFLNEQAGIGLKALVPDLNQSRVDGFINRISNAENFDEIRWILKEPVVNYSQAVVDDSIKINAEFHQKAGLNPKIIRKAYGNCCPWCQKLEGTYPYSPDMDRNVFRRHQNCRCRVLYDPADGKGKVQDAHTKQWKSAPSRPTPKPVSMGGFGDQLGQHKESIQHLLEKAPQPAREVWNKYAPYLHIKETNCRGTAGYERSSDAVKVNLADDSKRANPYTSFFHEMGHHIDFVAGRKDFSVAEIRSKNIAYTFEGGALAKAIESDLNASLELHALKTGSVTKAGKPKVTKAVKMSWLKAVQEAYTEDDLGDLSDMIEYPIGFGMPLGTGHGMNYWKLSPAQKTLIAKKDLKRVEEEKAAEKRSSEAFAEMFSATMANPGSLEVIQKYLPSAYEIFLKILKEIG